MDTLETGVSGLDRVLGGGIPKGYTLLVGGMPGAGKTVLTSHIRFHQARQGGRVLVLSALAESATKLSVHLGRFSFFDPELIGDGFQILDLQRLLTTDGLEATLAEIRREVLARRVGLLILDSLRGLHTLAAAGDSVHRFVHGLGVSMFAAGCTTVLLDDRTTPGGDASAEHTLADAVISLEVSLRGRRELRRLRAVKVRGAQSLTGQHTYAITGDGVRVYPRIESMPVEMQAPPTSDDRLSWGVPGLDELTGGGIPAYSSTLLMGTTGIGKTTTALHFAAAGIAAGQRCLYLSFHESPEDLLRKAARFGMDLRRATESGALAFVRVPAAEPDVDEVLNALVANVEDQAFGRVVIDTLNPLERDAAHEERFTAMLATLASVLRDRRATTLLLREMTHLISQDLDLSDGREAYWTPLDNLVLLRPVEMGGSLSRIISVLKIRSRDHDRRIHGYTIGEQGVEIGEAISGLQGLLMGLPRRDAQMAGAEADSGKKILVVDDEVAIAQVLRLLLGGDRVEVLVAQNGQEALEVLREERPQLILSDVMIPVLDGRELCRRVRADPATSHIAILLMSAAHQKGVGEWGADAFIRKPFDLPAFTELVDRFLERAG